MNSPSLADVSAAAVRTAGVVRHTPVLATTVPTPAGEVPVVFKLEYLQRGGTFKFRGSANAVLSAREHGTLGSAGVVVASGGNAAIGAAHAAKLVDVPCTVVVPETAPTVKVAALRALGAVVHQVGDRYAEAAHAAEDLAQTTGALRLHAYDLPDIVAGAGTLGLELRAQVAGPLTVSVCVGGGGLLSGIATAAGADDTLVAVEPERAPTLHAALDAGAPVDVDVSGVAADSLGATRVGAICWATVTRRPVTSLLVTDDEIVAARALLWDRFRIVVEHGTAAALAPVLSGVLTPSIGHHLVVVLCGANTVSG
ncbi:serine/threonine dehydratase [Williamsia sterculiae]|uniref:Threonine dehydratase n=1 Tax=Williamsia sterculiae TaxID=1344003 RepID=A0A1N7DVZ4_9NOCA|nr:serine/threonine dehydratase [Williamsia sterculiae]SIR80019.1 threonine dehydratase [Williamsia sterculiae]